MTAAQPSPDGVESDVDDDSWVLTPSQRQSSPELLWLDTYTRLLDTRFQIPRTGIRFGADFLLGLIPVVGDIVSLGLSGILVATMAKHGASTWLLFRMLINIGIDAAVGAVPFLGNVFDLFFKANTRNLMLMREYYDDGKHQGRAWPFVIAILVGIGMLVIAMSIAFLSFVRWIFLDGNG